VDGLPPATLTTLAEVRAADGPCEIVGWQVLLPMQTNAPCVGLSLRARDKLGGAQALADAAGDSTPSGAAASVNCVDVHAALKSAAKVRAGKDGGAPGSSGAEASRSAASSGPSAPSSEWDEYLRRPLLLPSPLFGMPETEGAGIDPPSAGAVARAVAAVQGGQVADLVARQLVLKHLADQVPVRAASAQAELLELRNSNDDLRRAAAGTKQKVERIQERQKDLEAKHQALITTLGAELQVRALNGVAAEELPRLWAQLHDLRQAFEVLRAAAAPAAGLTCHGVEWFSQVEQLQRAWTEPTAESLRAQAVEVEAAVAAAARAAQAQRHGVAAAG